MRQTGKAMNNQQALQHIEASLKQVMPEMKYYYKTNERGRYLVVEQSAIVGIGIWYNSGKLNIESLIPSERLNKRLGKAAKLMHLFKRKKRQDLADTVVEVIKKLTK